MSICSRIDSCVLESICTVVYHFQTLLTGAAAIGVAIIAGIPVWRQLKDTNLQTRISHRETLAGLLREALRRYEKVDQEMKQPLSVAVDVTSDPEGEPVEIGTHDANGVENMLNGLLSWYLVVLKGTENAEIETAKAALKTALDDAVETLGDAHWADHNDPEDPDLDISAEKWEEIVERCAAAKIEASSRINDMDSAYRALKRAQQNWVDALRRQIAKLDIEIVSSQ